MVSDSFPVMHISQTETHMIEQTEQPWTKAHAIYGGKTPSFLFLFNPPTLVLRLCHSHSVRTPLATMCCRQRPQHVHCLGDERRTGTRAASVSPYVRPSLPSLTRRCGESRPLLMPRPIVPGSQSSVSPSPYIRLPLVFWLFFLSSGLWGRSYHFFKEGK